jgi:predicted GIY-YIG superfamily endonuclease
VSLACSVNCPSRDDARKLEHQLKAWSRAKKLALINGEWSELQRLAKKPRYRPK